MASPAEPAPSNDSTFKCPPLASLVAALRDGARPIAARMRAIFYLRTLGGADAVAALCEALGDKSSSVLFRHEVAYVLGQMQAAAAVPVLRAVLRDTADEVIVRHEVRGEGERRGACARCAAYCGALR